MATRGKGPTPPKKKSTVAPPHRDQKPFQNPKRVNMGGSKKAFRGIQKH